MPEAAAAAQLAATAAAVAAAKAVKAAAAPEKVTVKELTGSKMARKQASGKKQLDKKKERTRVKAFKTACLQFAEVKRSGELTSQQVCDWVSFQICLSPARSTQAAGRTGLQQQGQCPCNHLTPPPPPTTPGPWPL